MARYRLQFIPIDDGGVEIQTPSDCSPGLDPLHIVPCGDYICVMWKVWAVEERNTTKPRLSEEDTNPGTPRARSSATMAATRFAEDDRVKCITCNAEKWKHGVQSIVTCGNFKEK